MSTATSLLLTEMQRTVTRNLLVFQAGQQMWCPGCKRILDGRRAVSIDWYRDQEQVGTRMLCTTCYDAKCAAGKLESQMESTGLRVVITDSRTVFDLAPAAATPAAPTPNALHAKDIQVGGRYEIHHTSGWVVVKVIRLTHHQNRSTRSGLTPPRTVRYVCLNEKTGREIVVKSAAKFRKEVK